MVDTFIGISVEKYSLYLLVNPFRGTKNTPNFHSFLFSWHYKSPDFSAEAFQKKECNETMKESIKKNRRFLSLYSYDSILSLIDLSNNVTKGDNV